MNRHLYSLVMYLCLPYALWRICKRYGGFHLPPWREYFGFCPLPASGERLLWMHTVSLGEAVAAAPLAQRLQAEGYRLLLTYTTPAGRDWLRTRYPQALIAALPLDLPAAVRRFFSRTRPVAGIVMEAEYWHNLLVAAKAGKVPLMLANARLGRKNARRYGYIAALMRRMVGCFDIIAAQTARDAGRLRCFGARRIATAGNLKFDLSPPSAEKWRLNDKPTVLFAVTRAGEEELLLAAGRHGDWRDFFAVLAPRHPQRRAEISALLKKHRLRHQLRSACFSPAEGCQVYVADTLGEMHKWYACCDVAIIGGSFFSYGGQNPIEAMSAGVAVVVGPDMENYARLVRRAQSAGALVQAADAVEAMAWARRLLADGNARLAMQKSARCFYATCRGALEQHIILLQQLLTAKAEQQ